MREFKKVLALFLCLSMVLSLTLPNFATDNDSLKLSSSDYTTTVRIKLLTNNYVTIDTGTEWI